jgi:hypothetical protein
MATHEKVAIFDQTTEPKDDSSTVCPKMANPGVVAIFESKMAM